MVLIEAGFAFVFTMSSGVLRSNHPTPTSAQNKGRSKDDGCFKEALSLPSPRRIVDISGRDKKL
jgi:hypothetical protein